MIQLHTIDVRVYYEDTDAGGIVYYANYLRYFERSRSDWLRALGLDHQWLATQGVALVVRRCDIEYCRPARLDDLLAIDTGLLEPRLDIRRASIRLQHRARLRDSDALLAQGSVHVACIRPGGGPVALPDAALDRLRESVPPNGPAVSTA
ncbi:MAG: YbgC/FadM family acyl-CoA thioesterase [Lautropia sp.]|nr:YbgC/FadM family acyl-CoA thioesterase [Lautropia sp.]